MAPSTNLLPNCNHGKTIVQHLNSLISLKETTGDPAFEFIILLPAF